MSFPFCTFPLDPAAVIQTNPPRDCRQINITNANDPTTPRTAWDTFPMRALLMCLIFCIIAIANN